MMQFLWNMQASLQSRQENRNLRMVRSEVNEDLAVFSGILNGKGERTDHLLLEESDEFDDSKSAEPKPDGLLILNASLAETFLIAADDNLLNLEMQRSDYVWYSFVFSDQNDASY